MHKYIPTAVAFLLVFQSFLILLSAPCLNARSEESQETVVPSKVLSKNFHQRDSQKFEKKPMNSEDLLTNSRADKAHKLEPGSEIPVKYKSKKASLIWDKALRKHGADRKLLSSLAEDLRTIDDNLMLLKQLKFDGKDPYGEQENLIEKSIYTLLAKYGLQGKTDRADKTVSNKVEDYLKNDERYEQMYNKAKSLGFSQEELQELKDEIFHHKRKMAELDELVGNLKSMEQKAMVSSNMVDENADAQKQGGVKLSKLQQMKALIKEKQEEVVESRSRLSLISDNPRLPENAEFTQAKVLRLWMSIIKSNFTQEERESLKEELMHLEKKMNKRDKLKEEKATLVKHENSLHPSHAAKKEKYAQRREKFEEKAEYLDKHVKKYLNDLNQRVLGRRHIEL